MTEVEKNLSDQSINNAFCHDADTKDKLILLEIPITESSFLIAIKIFNT